MSKKTDKSEIRSLVEHILDEVSCHSAIEGICRGCADNRDPHIIVNGDLRYGKDDKTDFERLADGILLVLQRHGFDTSLLSVKGTDKKPLILTDAEKIKKIKDISWDLDQLIIKNKKQIGYPLHYLLHRKCKEIWEVIEDAK